MYFLATDSKLSKLLRQRINRCEMFFWGISLGKNPEDWYRFQIISEESKISF